MPMGDLSYEKVEVLLAYDCFTGLLTWKFREDAPKQWNTRNAGKVAGTKRKDGYIQICIHGKFYQAARLAWTLAMGDLPPIMVDHVNGYPTIIVGGICAPQPVLRIIRIHERAAGGPRAYTETPAALSWRR